MRYLIVFVFSCLPFGIFSQIVNIEDQRQNAPEMGLSGQADFNFNINKNTTVLYQLGNRIQARYREDEHLFLFFNEINLVKADGEDFVNGGFQHLRYNKIISEKFRWEAFTQSQYNGVQKIDWRYLLGAGPRFTLLNTDSLAINTGVLTMFEYEQLKEGLGSEATVRLSAYLSFKFDITKNMNLSSTTYYQPKVWNFKDYRISNETTFNIGLTNKLSLKVVYTLVYDSRPAFEVPETIYNLKNAISYKF
ncbi:DUF481 domain-containing protein [bacterium]|nr:DUF481 domain-containing protein [bacterium]